MGPQFKMGFINKFIIVFLISMLSPLTVYSVDDMVKLESTFIGDKEQPPVTYFIPWQPVGASNDLYRGIEGSFDDTLEAVDRDILNRSIRIYNDMDLEGK